jgi:Uma2 family endonuclease
MTEKDTHITRETLAEMIKEIAIEFLPRWLEELRIPHRQVNEPPRHCMSYEDFLEWADEDTWAEWVNGEIQMVSPASRQHQNLAGFLTSILRAYVEHHDLGMVLSAPFQMKLKQGREPDLLFVSKSNLDRLKETYLDGPADLVLEITSPGSLERDRGAKFVEYEAGGVSEYWLIDPLREWAEFYHLQEEGRYKVVCSGQAGSYQSRIVPGFWLRIEWLWQDPLPDLARVTWEIIGVEGLRKLLAELEMKKTQK